MWLPISLLMWQIITIETTVYLRNADLLNLLYIVNLRNNCWKSIWLTSQFGYIQQNFIFTNSKSTEDTSTSNMPVVLVKRKFSQWMPRWTRLGVICFAQRWREISSSFQDTVECTHPALLSSDWDDVYSLLVTSLYELSKRGELEVNISHERWKCKWIYSSKNEEWFIF